MPSIPTIKLNDGSQIPVLSFGTGTAWYNPEPSSALNPELVAMLKDAIVAGYRHLDTAEDYGTEGELGRAIKESGVPREEFFVASKLRATISEEGPNAVEKGLNNTLKQLGLDYVDLYYLHSPYCTNDSYVEADVAKEWKQLEAVQRAGKARSIGVSNFRKNYIENLLKTAEIKPSINQIQFSAYTQGAPQYAKWLLSQGIATASYMGLTPITHLKGNHLDSTLEEVAGKYGVSKATVLIRWQLDQGLVVVNTTKKMERMKEYFDALDLKLSKEDWERITEVGQSSHLRVPLMAIYDGGEVGPYDY